MAVNFNIQFRINATTRVIRLTDASSGFTYGKGCFKVEFPDGSVRNLPDFANPDLNSTTVVTVGYIDIPCVTDINSNVITGTYTISYAATNNTATVQTPLVRTFDFNWIEPSNGITNFSDVIIPEVVFKDLTSYSPIGSFTGALYTNSNTRTVSCAFPSTSEASANSPIPSTTTNTVTIVSGTNYYEGDYTPTSAVSINYTHSTNGWLTIFYSRTFSKTFSIKKCPNQLELVGKINTYRGIIDAYKETNDTQFNILSEQYDLVIALYSHLIARYTTNTQDGSEAILRELLSILEPYTGAYTYQATKMLPFELTSSGSNSFSISDGTNVDAVQLGSTLTFASGNASLVPIVTNNNVTYSPTFGTLINTFAQGNDSRFHNPVTIGTANGLSISTQALSLAAATSGSAGAMSSADKTKLDGIATGATANTGTVTSVALTTPAAFTVTGSPITTAGTLAIAAAGTSAQYITGTGALATLNTANVPENTNLYYTNARSRAAISLTTTGTTGAATYDNATGILNIPSYIGGVTSFNTRTGAIVLSSSDVTTALTYIPVPNNRSLTINGVSYDLSADRSWTIASGVTSFNSRTGAITPTAGDYTTALVTEVTNLYYTDARARAAISLTTTGTSGSATYNNTTGILNIPAYQGGVTSFNTRTGAITLTSGDVTTALTYTPYNATNPSAYISLTSLSFVAGSGGYNNTTGVITIPTNNNQITNGAGYITGITSGNVTTALGYTPENAANKGIANGYASLDGGGLVPSTQLPSYVDDVLEYTNLAGFPATGVTGKIYVDLATNKIYRWSGSTYIEVSPTVGTIWGGITGTLSNQTDLQDALNLKVPYSGATSDVNLGANNLIVNNIFDGFSSVTASGTQIILTVASVPSYLVSGSGGQTFKLPNATTIPNGTVYVFNNNQSSGAISVNNNSNSLVKSIPSGGYALIELIDNSTAAGSWDTHFQAPSNVSWSTNTFDYAGSITSATWNGVVVTPNRGGTGQSTYTDGQLLIGNSTGNTLSKSTLTAGTGIAITNGSGTITISSTITQYTDALARASISGSTGISYNSTTGVITNTITQYTDALARASLSFTAGSGAYNSTTGVITIPTNNSQLTNGANYITLTSLSATSPIVYTNTTGVISIPVATTSVNGYLSSTDWTTFNNKANALSGTTNTLAKFTSSSAIGNSNITDSGSLITFNGLEKSIGTTASDTAPLGSELAAVTGTGTNWTLAGTNLNVGGYSHTTGDVTPLTTTLAAVSGTYYQITYTITSRTTGSITIAYGGTSTLAFTGTSSTGPLASSTAVLTITPTTDFNGTVVLSIKSIGTSSASSTFANSSGGGIVEVRASGLTNNVFFGNGAGRRNTTGNDNTFFGYITGQNNTTGTQNVFIGNGTGTSNTIGGQNTFVGISAGFSNTTGISNTFIGQAAGNQNTTGSTNTFLGITAGFSTSSGLDNVFLGGNAGYFNSSANYNTSVGSASGFNNTTGANNVFFGRNAGRFISDGSTSNAITDNSIYIGYNTKALASSQTNQIVIGYNSTGLGSNTTVLGNSSTVTTAIYGNLLLGTTATTGANLTTASSVTAASAIARGVYFNNTLVAAANSDVLVGLDINPTFTNGAFTGVTNYALRVQGKQLITFADSNYLAGLVINNTSTSTASSASLGLIVNGVTGGGIGYLPSNWVTAIQRSTLLISSNGANKIGFSANIDAVGGQAQDIWFSTLGVNSTYQMQIKGNGNVQINSNTDNGYRLEVVGTAKVSGVLTLGSTISNGTYTYTLPSATGTLALTSDLSSYVPTTRTITINGTTYDLSADRTFTISTNPSARVEQNFTATAGQTTFTITGGYVVGLVDVYVNGVRYLPSDYTATNGTTVVLGIGLLVNDAVTILNYTSSIAALPTSRNVQDFTATSAQTTFTVTNGYIVGLIDVFVNGSKLTSSEFTATNGTTFVLTVASTVGDQVQSINYTASVNGISGAGTINELAYFTASGTIASLPVATYPSLTELSYVKGATSSIQTQLNAKAAALSGTTNYHAKFTSSTTIGNSLIYDNGTNALGVGVTPSSWNSLFNVIDVSTTASLAGTSSAASLFNNAYYNGTNYIYKTTDYALRYFQGGGGFHIWYTAPSGTAGNAITFSEAMRIDSGGSLLISTTSSSGNATGGSSNIGSVIGGGTITSQRNDSSNMFLSKASGFTEGILINFFAIGTSRGNISTNGVNTSYNTSSDYRLKEDLKEYNGLNIIRKLKTYDFKWKDTNIRDYGMMAHELQEILPNYVTGNKDEVNNNGTIKTQAVDYSKLVPLLVKSIQEQQSQIEELKTLLKA